MIPIFPEFKKITISDRKSIESYQNTLYSYSTYNFTNLWSWNTTEERMFSDLNGNLVVFYTEYKTGKPFLSFLGINKVKQTLETLEKFATENNISTQYRFITDETVRFIPTDIYEIVEDRDNFDYIVSTENLSKPLGIKLKGRRHLAHRFVERFTNSKFLVCNIKDKAIQQQIINVIRKWEENKIFDKKNYDLKYEEEAILRLFRTADEHELILTCVFVDDTMIGFSIDELLKNKYATAHFIKCDNTFKGVYEFLNESTANVLLTKGVQFWNWQQDLGITGLRELKLSYQPVSFLKKYLVKKIN